MKNEVRNYSKAEAWNQTFLWFLLNQKFCCGVYMNIHCSHVRSSDCLRLCNLMSSFELNSKYWNQQLRGLSCMQWFVAISVWNSEWRSLSQVLDSTNAGRIRDRSRGLVGISRPMSVYWVIGLWVISRHLLALKSYIFKWDEGDMKSLRSTFETYKSWPIRWYRMEMDTNRNLRGTVCVQVFWLYPM